MFIKDWKKDLFTIPNFLSLFRLALIPVYLAIYGRATGPRDYFLAGAILALSCLTDLIDGQIARHFNMVSNVGKILDPVADKFTQLALTICLSLRYPVLRSVLLLFLLKETFQTLSMFLMYHQGKVLSGAIIPGKVCTTVLFSGFILLVLLPDPDHRIVNTVAMLDSVALLYAFLGYFLAYFGKDPKLHSIQE